MVVEAAILDGDDGVLQVGGDLVERDVVPLLVEPEPRLAVGAVEHRVADAARQPVDARRRSATATRRDAAPPTTSASEQRQRDPVGPAGAGAAGSAVVSLV